MAKTIRMTPDLMHDRARQFRTEADSINAIISRMDTLLKSLQSEWEGSASVAYSERYEALKPFFLRAEEVVREIEAALDVTAKRYEEVDATVAGQFRG